MTQSSGVRFCGRASLLAGWVGFGDEPKLCRLTQPRHLFEFLDDIGQRLVGARFHRLLQQLAEQPGGCGGDLGVHGSMIAPLTCNFDH